MKSISLSGVLVVVTALAFSVSAETIKGIDLVSIDSAGTGGVGYNYKIGQTEVSVAQWEASGIADSGAAYDVYRADLGDAAPVVNISWDQAARYCNYLTSGFEDVGAYSVSGTSVTGVTDHASAAMSALVAEHGIVFVLPTEAEWRKAAYWTGSEYSLYANGTDTAPVNGTDARYDYAQGDGPWTVTEGATEQNGTKNMMGNVWEWMESTYGGEDFDHTDDSQLMAFRGGDWFVGDGDEYLKETARAYDDRAATFNVGFRVAAIPEPGTISLMSISTIGILFTRTVRRRRRASSILPVRRVHACDVFSENELIEDELDSYSFFGEFVLPVIQRFTASIKGAYAKMDRNFWNHMVVVHEHRVAKRAAYKEALKTRFFDGLDAFLAKIMK